MADDDKPPLLSEIRPITLNDRPVFAAALARLAEPISDSSFTTSFLWSQPLELSWADLHGHLCIFSAADGDLSMILPPMAFSAAAEALLPECLDACFEIMDAYNAPRLGADRSRIEYVSDEMLDRIRLSERNPLSAAPMHGDYVYPLENIVELAGGDLKSKRRLRNLFLRNHPDAATSELRDDDVAECMELLERWKRHGDVRHEGEANDHLIGTDILRRRDESSTITALRRHRELGLETMVVRVGGRIVGFTLGERLTPTMAVVHIEKTDPEVEGTPQFIYSEFCRQRFAGCTEVNAGDDWGIPSLRFTKQSYRPSRMLNKNILTRQPVVVAAGVEPSVVAAVQETPEPRFATRPGSPAGLSIRAAHRDDARAVCSIEEHAFERAGERFTLRQAQRLITNPRASVAVAEIDGQVVGWAVSLVRTHRRWKSGRIYAVAVRPDLAGRGIGRALVSHALAAFEQATIARVYLEVREDNTPAITLYTSLGFEPIARLFGYYGANTSGVRMRRVTPLPAPTPTLFDAAAT